MKITRVVWPAARQVEMQSVELTAPGPRELMIRTTLTLISPGTERAWLLGLPNTPQTFPIVPGYCHAGVVEEIGPGVEEFRVGQRVTSTAHHASHVLVAAASVFSIPDGVSDAHATFCSLCVIASQAVRKTRVELGETVVVLGQGLVGNLALQFARLSGASPAVGVDPVQSRRALALKCGADMALAPGERNAFVKQTGGAHVVLEATIRPETILDALQWVRPRGRISLMGGMRGETNGLNFYRDVHKPGVVLIGAHTMNMPAQDSSPGYWTRRDEAEAILRLMSSHRLKLDPLLVEQVPAQDAPKLYQRLVQGDESFLGVLMQWN